MGLSLLKVNLVATALGSPSTLVATIVDNHNLFESSVLLVASSWSMNQNNVILIVTEILLSLVELE